MKEFLQGSHIRAQSAPWNESIEVLILAQVGHGRRAVVKDIVMETVEDAVMIDPTIRLPMESAQVLMDDLWHCGIRPTDGVDHPGELKATKKHLQDLRRMVFKNLGIDGG